MRELESGSLFISRECERTKMAERNSVPSSPKAGNRRESTDSCRTESLACNVEFMRLLGRLPDELRRLERKIKKLERELNSSSSRVDSSSKRAEKFWQSRWENQEKEFERKQEEKILQIRNHYEQQLKNSTEVLQKNNNDLQKLLKVSRDDGSQKADENEKLKKELEKLKRQLDEQTGISSKHRNHSHRFKQALEAKRIELNSFKERHAAFSERRVRSDQRRTENTLSRNRQSQLESEYVVDFKDGARVDAIDVMTTRAWRFRGTRSDSKDLYLKCCRFACFIFETAYEVVAKTKDSFVKFTHTTLKTLAADAPGIGRDIAAFQHKLLTQQYNRQRETTLPTQDALSEVMILVKEEAKTHDLSLLVNDVKIYISTNWQTRHLGLEYDCLLLDDLNDYIKYCTRFAWCALTQVPPLRIDYSTAVYNSESHTVSQAFPHSPTSRPAYPEGQRIRCYLWPSLQDCDGKVIRKGEVVLYDCVYDSTYYRES